MRRLGGLVALVLAVACGRDDGGGTVAVDAATTTTAAAPVVVDADPSEFSLSPDPQSAAQFSGNDAGVVGLVESIGERAEVTTGPDGAEITYGFTPVSIRVEEVLFGDVAVDDEPVIRSVEGGDAEPTSYVVGRRYVLLLNAPVDVEGTGLMSTPNWAFLLDGDELLWHASDTGEDRRMPLDDFRALAAERG
jgi:hypothetical protein